MAKNSCGILIKGLRDVKDFSEEMTYSFANKNFQTVRLIQFSYQHQKNILM